MSSSTAKYHNDSEVFSPEINWMKSECTQNLLLAIVPSPHLLSFTIKTSYNFSQVSVGEVSFVNYLVN